MPMGGAVKDDDGGRPGHHPWALWRQDDNGNRFLVSLKETREEVQKLQEMYEKRGHKQYYFIEPFEGDIFSPTGN